MLKKIISGVLSLAMCSSLAVTLKTSNEEEVSKSTENKTDYQLSGTNSLGNYLSQMSNEKKNETAPATETSLYSVTALDFDAATRSVHVCSTQSRDCNVTVTIADEETGKAVFTAAFPVESGELVVTEEKLDVSSLPEYFIVKAFLSDEMGAKLSNEYVFTNYTKDMQEILNADIHDFDEEQVVNFDESEDTNFIVLSDDTVISESTEDENVLVDADYDSNVFTFENADMNIRSMEFGQYFYIQPNDTDIIAVAVDSVETDGDITTVKGSDEPIDDMFDFIKIEQNELGSTMTVDTTDKSDDVTIVGHEDEDVFEADGGIEFNVVRKRYDAEFYISNSVSLDISPLIKTFTGDSELAKMITGKLEVYAFANFYKHKDHLEYEVKIVPRLKIDIKYTTPDPFKQKTTVYFDEMGEYKSEEVKPFTVSFGHYEIPTQIPGLHIGFDPRLEVTLSGTIDCSFTIKHTYITKHNSDEFIDPEKISHTYSYNEIEESPKCSKILIEGGLSIRFILDPKVIIIRKQLVNIGLQISMGIDYTLGNRDSAGNIMNCVSWKDYPCNGDETVYAYKSDSDSEHGCDFCLIGKIDFVAELSVFGELFDKPLIKFGPLQLKIPILETYYSNRTGFHVGKTLLDGKKAAMCDNKRYKASFTVLDSKTLLPISGAEIDIDGVIVKTDSNGVAYVFCDNGSYPYVLAYSSLQSKGTFKINNAANNLNIKINSKTDKDGNVTYSLANSSATKGAVHTTVSYTTTTRTTTTTIAPLNTEHSMIKGGALGDHIGYSVYGDGTMLIYGYGDMDDKLTISALKGVRDKVTEVVFEPCELYAADPATGQNIAEPVAESDLKFTSIGSSLFENCVNLEKITIPDTVTRIGNSAFLGCKSIPFGDYKVHDGVTYIGSRAFAQCYKMTSCVIPESVTEMGTGLFNRCLNLRSVTLPYAGRLPSDDRITLTEVLFDINGENIGGVFNFEDAEKFISHGYAAGGFEAYGYAMRNRIVAIPPEFDTITITGGDHIPDDAFSQCDYLKHINLPEGLETIGNYAFFECNAITELALPESLKTIGSSAFKNCSKLKNITLPSDVETIGSRAFSGCTSIESMLIPASVNTIGEEAFLYCTGLKEIEISEGVKEIGAFAFQECLNLKSVVIPNSVEKMGSGIVRLCRSLEEISLPFVGYSREQGGNIIAVLFYAEGLGRGGEFPAAYKDDELLVSVGYDGKIAAVPKNFRKLAITDTDILPDSSFYESTFIEEVILPDTLKTIDTRSFNFCSNMKVVIPESVTTIDDNTFVRSSNITIYGKKGSTAEEFATAKKIPFVAIGEDDYKPEPVTTVKVTTAAITTATTADPAASTTVTTTAEPENVLYGDANCNGEVDLSDSVLIMQFICNPNKYGFDGTEPIHMTKEGLRNSDVYNHGDGVTLLDALSIQRYCIQIIESLPESYKEK